VSKFGSSVPASFAGAWLVCGSVVLGQTAAPVERSGEETWRTTSGTVAFVVDATRVRDLGFDLHLLDATAASQAAPGGGAFAIVAPRGAASGIAFSTREGRFAELLGGAAATEGSMRLVRADGEAFEIGDFELRVSRDGRGSLVDRRGTGRTAFRISGGAARLDVSTGRLDWAGAEIAIDPAWARVMSLDRAAGAIVGTLLVEASASPAPFAAPSGPPPGEGGGGDSLAFAGPDVIVGDLQNTMRYGSVSGVTAFSVGTTSCNVGSQPLSWNAFDAQHPVIAQNLYRLKNRRFEQIGMSWLKHGFFAESEFLCFPDCQTTDGATLGVHCSDPYNANLNGDQGNLGPRWQVNASTGSFPYPPANPNTPATIGRRLQVHDADLDPAQNAGALYFVEGQYVTPDDAAAGNGTNNASYRPVNVGGAPGSGVYDLSLTGSTVREESAIHAWKAADPSVILANVDVPNDGRFTLGYLVTDNGDGTWHYEYALHNMNSDRSAQSFSVPVPPGLVIRNVGFHDVDYHSGDGIDGVTTSGTDWTSTVLNGAITWSTQSSAVNPNANALRWGTLYDFRFDANAPPTPGLGTITLFKAGSPGSVTVATRVPTDGTPCVDQAPPDVTCPGSASVEATSAAGATIAFDATATDDCSLDPAIACVPPSGSTFPLGTTTVTCTASDEASHSASCTFDVTVLDTTPPTLGCGNLVREGTSPSGATVAFDPFVSDAVDPSPTVTCTPPSGSVFGFGTTAVDCSAADHASPPNVRTCSFGVTVRDTTAPTIQCPGNIQTSCDATSGVVTFAAMATDACDPAPIVTCSPPSGSTFPVGLSRVNCIAYDHDDNQSSCIFRIFVSGPAACFAGDVGSGEAGAHTVLFVDESAGTGCTPTVSVAVRAPISVRFDAAAPGTTNGAYTLWVWRATDPFTSTDLVMDGVTIGCTAYPTPFAGALGPQPFRCLRAGMPASYCGASRENAASPPGVPWALTRNQGLRRPVRLLLQGIVEDSGSGSALAVSVTNAVVVDVR
jgi:HYR domain-containing protein